MTVTIAGRPIFRLAGKHSRLVLGLIEGGREWLEWAIYDPVARYHFDDEGALVAGVQAGLHASTLLLLPNIGLLVGPLKLMTLDLKYLHMLVEAEACPKPDKAMVRKLCGHHGLVTQSQLADDEIVLEKLGLASRPVLEGMAFDDQLAIHALLVEEKAEIDPDAAAFAADQARTPLEFVDYYLAYQQYLARLPKPPPIKERAARVRAAFETLRPLLFQALDSPRVDAMAAPSEVAAAIDEWLMMGRRLGFSRLSQGVQQVIAHTEFPGSYEDDAPRIVARYLADAQDLLGSAELHHPQIGQDGASCTFQIRSDTGDAAIALSRDGIITLSRFTRRFRKPAMPPTHRRK
jgi:hypothetical protein